MTHLSPKGAYLLGIDAGTTAMKAVLFDLEGHPLGQASQEYQLHTPAPDRAELEPQDYWAACCGCTRGLLAEAGVDPRQIAALAISSQGETLVVVDEAGQPLYPAIVWLDNRSQAEANEISAQFEVETVFQVTGQPEVTPTWHLASHQDSLAASPPAPGLRESPQVSAARRLSALPLHGALRGRSLLAVL
jgi:xylulokinase